MTDSAPKEYCDALTEIGDFPTGFEVQCDREKGHTGPHTAEFTWEDDDA